MKHTRKYTYVERELMRLRAEKKRRVVEKFQDILATLALIVCGEVFMFALVLMS